MVTATQSASAEPWMRRLFLPAYRVSEAARYTKVHPNTVAGWHYRANPLLPGREKKRPLSYMELVEVAFVAFFRRLGMTTQRIRAAREYIAQNIESEYPFTTLEFKTEGFHILMEYHQFDPAANMDQVVVADEYGQLAWSQLMGEQFTDFDYEYEITLPWHPAGRNSQVVIDPRISFGAPTVSGLPTWAIRGRYDAGETFEDIVKEFQIEETAVRHALIFEDRIAS